MRSEKRLTRAFFNRPALTVAPDLLGKRLVRIDNGQRIAGIIIETEAYSGEEDLGCHCRAGRTPRTQVMYGPPGHAYIYFTYGMHWMLNFVVDNENFPAAVLIRAIFPTEGLNFIATNRKGRPRDQWTDGPAKLCQALNISGELNGIDLCTNESVIFVEDYLHVPTKSLITGPRVGLNSVPEPWKSIPWRFRVSSEILNLSKIMSD